MFDFAHFLFCFLWDCFNWTAARFFSVFANKMFSLKWIIHKSFIKVSNFSQCSLRHFLFELAIMEKIRINSQNHHHLHNPHQNHRHCHYNHHHSVLHSINKLAKARKTRTSPGTLGSKKFGLCKLWVQKVFGKYTFKKYTFRKYTFVKYIFEKYSFKKYTFETSGSRITPIHVDAIF